jgi:hypothetical protein
MMKILVEKMVSALMEALMWATFIGCIMTFMVSSGIAGYMQFGIIGAIFGAVIGAVIGAIAGMLANMIWWLFSTFQEIRNYLREIAGN